MDVRCRNRHRYWGLGRRTLDQYEQMHPSNQGWVKVGVARSSAAIEMSIPIELAVGNAFYLRLSVEINHEIGNNLKRKLF
jgi:hypothetical protein